MRHYTERNNSKRKLFIVGYYNYNIVIFINSAKCDVFESELFRFPPQE